MHGYLASTAGYQTLIASLSECGFHLMFGTDSNIKKEYKRILDPQRFYFPSHTYIEIMKDRILLRDGKTPTSSQKPKPTKLMPVRGNPSSA